MNVEAKPEELGPFSRPDESGNKYKCGHCRDKKIVRGLLYHEDKQTIPCPACQLDIIGEGDVEFTQFLFPKGKRKTITIKLTPALAEKAKKLKEKGFTFEIENKDGQIWASIVDHSRDIAYDKFFSNGPGVPKAIAFLIQETFDKVCER